MPTALHSKGAKRCRLCVQRASPLRHFERPAWQVRSASAPASASKGAHEPLVATFTIAMSRRARWFETSSRLEPSRRWSRRRPQNCAVGTRPSRRRASRESVRAGHLECPDLARYLSPKQQWRINRAVYRLHYFVELFFHNLNASSHCDSNPRACRKADTCSRIDQATSSFLTTLSEIHDRRFLSTWRAGCSAGFSRNKPVPNKPT